jgi:calcium-dependent protein kinase
VTELCTGGELFNQIIEEKSLSEKKASRIIRQVLSAIYYCHQHNIVHRDLKPENLLLESKKSDSSIKVIDFGTSRFFNTNKKMH